MEYIGSIKSAINKVLDKTIGVFELAVLGIIVISTLSYALAWQAPGGNPPSGNTDAPINTGSSGQAKSGGLILNTGGAATGLVVQTGNVGIGTINPSQKLEVNGYVKGNDGICVGNNCKANWPTISCVTVTQNGNGPQTATCPVGYIITGGGGQAPDGLDRTEPIGNNA